MNRFPGRLLWLLAIWFSCCALTALPGAEQPFLKDTRFSQPPGAAVGQTFFSRYPGLQGVTVVVDPPMAGGGEVELSLFAAPGDERSLAVSRQNLPPGRPAGPLHFSFAPRADSRGQGYYFRIRNLGTETLYWGTAPAENYLEGALYEQDQPREGQLTFGLTYQPAGRVTGLVREMFGGLGLFAAAVFLLIIPGWALMAYGWPGFSELDWLEKTGVAGGVGLALVPVLQLWTNLAGWPGGPFYSWGPALAGLTALAWKYRSEKPARRFRSWVKSDRVWIDTALVLLVAGLFFLRLANIRFLPAPLFGDSYQHTTIVQLILDHGGLFQSWEPYVPYRSFTVHFGFPATAAVFSWLGGWASPEAVLRTGQIINVLAVLALYPLFCALSGSRGWGGAAVILAAGFLSPLPAYYLNWGRYAQLSGQAILPVALWAVWETWKKSAAGEKETPLSWGSSFRPPWSRVVLGGLLLGGMTLHYYRMPFFFMGLTAALLIVWGLPTWRGNGRRWLVNLWPLVLIVLLSLFWAAPRLGQLQGSGLSRFVAEGVRASIPWSAVVADWQTWRILPRYAPGVLLGTALLGFGFSLYRKKWPITALFLWPLLMNALILGWLISLPGSHMMQSFAILIFSYIPLSLLAGYVVQVLAPDNRFWKCGPGGLIVCCFLIGLGLIWAGEQRKIPDPGGHALVTRPDLQAMSWLRTHTPASSLFLARGALVNRGASVVGTDAGWWLPLLALRRNNLPPEYALLAEQPSDPGYSRNIFRLATDFERFSPATPEGLALLRENGFTHVYIGQRSGRSPGPISFDLLARHPAFSLIYHRDRVSIFEIHYPPTDFK